MKKKLLLHACCAPCATSVLERLIDDYDVTVYYYNPNILPDSEYELRLNDLKRLADMRHVPLLIGEYDCERFLSETKTLTNEPEGGNRCTLCYEMRLRRTAETAKAMGYDLFTTTLSVSPHKNATLLNSIGQSLCDELGIQYLHADFKKRDGYLRSIQLSREYNLYRQRYCGCKPNI